LLSVRCLQSVLEDSYIHLILFFNIYLFSLSLSLAMAWLSPHFEWVRLLALVCGSRWNVFRLQEF
jgi:hypothetical protein